MLRCVALLRNPQIRFSASEFTLFRQLAWAMNIWLINDENRRLLFCMTVVIHMPAHLCTNTNSDDTTHSSIFLQMSWHYSALELMGYLNRMGLRNRPLVLGPTLDTYVKYD